MIVCGCVVRVSFLVEPVEIYVPDSLLAQLSSQPISGLNQANFHGKGWLNDSSQSSQGTSNYDNIALGWILSLGCLYQKVQHKDDDIFDHKLIDKVIKQSLFYRISKGLFLLFLVCMFRFVLYFTGLSYDVNLTDDIIEWLYLCKVGFVGCNANWPQSILKTLQILVLINDKKSIQPWRL